MAAACRSLQIVWREGRPDSKKKSILFYVEKLPAKKA